MSWDFGPAIELIRLQTLAITSECNLSDRQLHQVIHDAMGHVLEVESSSKAGVTALGNFEKIFSYLGLPFDRSSYMDPALSQLTDELAKAKMDDEADEHKFEGRSFNNTTNSEQDESVLSSKQPQIQLQATSSTKNEAAVYRDEAYKGIEEGRHQASRQEFTMSSEDKSTIALAKQRDLDPSSKRRRVIHDIVGGYGTFSDDANDYKRHKSSNQSLKDQNTRQKPQGNLIGAKVMCAPDSRLKLIEMLFGDAARQDTRKHPLPTSFLKSERIANGGIHVFVDISNILVGLHDTLKTIQGLPTNAWIPRVPLSFYNLALVLERGRNVSKRVLAGSDTLESIDEARKIGYEVNILERVVKIKGTEPKQKDARLHREHVDSHNELNDHGLGLRRVEQGVDEVLHLKILESILDTGIPSTIVLATGDAAESEYSGGFLRMIERALTRGWRVELVAFRENMSTAYRNSAWKKKWNGAFVTIELDAYATLLRLE